MEMAEKPNEQKQDVHIAQLEPGARTRENEMVMQANVPDAKSFGVRIADLDEVDTMLPLFEDIPESIASPIASPPVPSDFGWMFKERDLARHTKVALRWLLWQELQRQLEAKGVWFARHPRSIARKIRTELSDMEQKALIELPDLFACAFAQAKFISNDIAASVPVKGCVVCLRDDDVTSDCKALEIETVVMPIPPLNRPPIVINRTFQVHCSWSVFIDGYKYLNPAHFSWQKIRGCFYIETPASGSARARRNESGMLDSRDIWLEIPVRMSVNPVSPSGPIQPCPNKDS